MSVAIVNPRASVQSRVRDFTRHLVGIQSGPNFKKGENRVAEFLVKRLNRLDNVESREVPIGDALERKIAFGFLKRSDSPETLVLMGHTDTVGTEDYGDFKEISCHPDALKWALIGYLSKHKEANPLFEEAHRDLFETDDWFPGRGCLDMKSGLAAEFEALSQLSADPTFRGNVIFLGVPDEENDSAGMFAAVKHLNKFAREQNLRLVGVLNADYTSRRFLNDTSRYLYLGTVGKLLPTFYVVGKETHAGEVFNGLDAHQLNAELVRLVNLNPDLMDQAEGEVTVPPVSLLSAGLRDAYNVQTTLEAWSYFNLLTHCRSVSQVMEQMVSLAKEAAGNVEEHYRRSYTAFADASHLPADRSISIGVHTYESLAKVVGQGVDIEIPEGEDPRVTSRRIIQELWQKSGLPRPAIIAYLSPPYYPHSFISAEEAGTNPFIRSAVAVADGAGLVSRKFYPYISDGSFLRFSGQADDLVKHMPLWRRGGSGYSIPLEEMRTLNLPVANLGPFGKDAHQLTERVHAPYSFGTLPGLIEQVVRGTFERG